MCGVCVCVPARGSAESAAPNICRSVSATRKTVDCSHAASRTTLTRLRAADILLLLLLLLLLLVLPLLLALPLALEVFRLPPAEDDAEEAELFAESSSTWLGFESSSSKAETDDDDGAVRTKAAMRARKSVDKSEDEDDADDDEDDEDNDDEGG